MARTLKKWTRLYLGGYDMSGYANTFGPLDWTHDTPGITCLTDEVQGGLPNQPKISLGAFKGVLDNTAISGLHVIQANGAGAAYNVTAAVGIRAAPAAGDPVFCGKFVLDHYKADPSDGMVAAIMQFGDWDASALINYSKPWGVLLHPSGSETAVNTAIGIDDRGAATVLGGYMVYHILSITGSGTVTGSVQEASTNTDGNFALLTDATSGAIATATAPTSGIVPVGVTAAVKRYLRWQIAFGGSATACTFVLSFIRI